MVFGCVGYYYSQLFRRTLREGDCPSMYKRKNTLFNISVAMIFISLMSLPATKGTAYGLAGTLLCFLVFLGSLVWLLTVRTATDTYLMVTMLMASLACILIDFHSIVRLTGARFWPFLILVADVLLVCRIGRRFEFLVIVVATIWIFVTEVETAYRFGLYDLPGTTTTEYRLEQVSCKELPCARGAASATGLLLGSLLVFYFDFFVTRSFASKLFEERGRMEASIETAGKIAKDLAAFDLTRAASVLDESHVRHMPTELREAFLDILMNLEMYRPYLPQHLLPSDVHRHSRQFSDAIAFDEISASSSFRTESTSGPIVVHATVQAELSMRGISLLSASCRVDPSPLGDIKSFSRILEHMVSSALSIAKDLKGVVDSFAGDSVSMSFNASKICPSHSVSSISAAISLQSLSEREGVEDLRVSVSTAKSVCGDFGADSMKRFLVLGRGPYLLRCIEKANRTFKKDIVCSSGESAFIYELRIIPQALEVYTGEGDCTACQLVWEVLSKSSDKDPEKIDTDEWMYELDRGTSKRWEHYNEALKLYLQTNDRSRALSWLSAADSYVRSSPEYQTLLSRVSLETPPPPSIQIDPEAIRIL